MACWNAAVSVSSTGLGSAPGVATPPLPIGDVSGMKRPPPRGLQCGGLRGHHGSPEAAAPSGALYGFSRLSRVIHASGVGPEDGATMSSRPGAAYDLIVVGAG